ncbi:MAG: hypothetical protein U0166_29340 [Acidobacteriota bacterium]
MKSIPRLALGTLALLLVASFTARADSWKGVSIIDTACLEKVKADPDKHTTTCALQCQAKGYGVLTAEGAYLKFDAAGNEKALAALKATKKTDHLRVTVEGTKEGDTIKVTSLTLD